VRVRLRACARACVHMCVCVCVCVCSLDCLYPEDGGSKLFITIYMLT
jgi:hypothetical protein